MRIENGTCWSTNHVRRIAERVAECEGLTAETERLVLVLRFVPLAGHDDGIGFTHIGVISKPVFRIWIVMPSAPSRTNNGDPVVLAHTIAHELAHCRGLQHEDMRGEGRYLYEAGWRSVYGWAMLLPLAWVPRAGRRPFRAPSLQSASRQASVDHVHRGAHA